MPLPHAAALLERFAAPLPERAATFAERGWAIPFTSPLLAGARLRWATGGEPELILPSLAGRGSYVLGWAAARDVAQPTLHDRRLWSLATALPEPGPARLREAARQTAAEGLAGRQAAAAAGAEAALHARALAAVRAGLPANVPPALVEALAEIGQGRDGSVPRLATRLRDMAEELAGWLSGRPEDHAGRVVLGAARLTLAGVEACLDGLPARPRDAGAVALLRRPGWLLDGWRMLVAAWFATPPDGRADALAAMAAHLPIPAVEADEWPGAVCAWDPVLRLRRSLRPPAMLPSSVALPDLVARIERLLPEAA